MVAARMFVVAGVGRAALRVRIRPHLAVRTSPRPGVLTPADPAVRLTPGIPVSHQLGTEVRELSGWVVECIKPRGTVVAWVAPGLARAGPERACNIYGRTRLTQLRI
jgi:hypothetical protein